MTPPLVVFLRSADWSARWAAVSTALTAAALGARVHLALFDEPLRAFVEGDFDAGAPPQARSVGDPLSVSLAEGRAGLGVRVVACETAVRLAGLDPGAVVPPLDGLEGLPALWKMADAGRLLTF